MYCMVLFDVCCFLFFHVSFYYFGAMFLFFDIFSAYISSVATTLIARDPHNDRPADFMVSLPKGRSVR